MANWTDAEIREHMDNVPNTQYNSTPADSGKLSKISVEDIVDPGDDVVETDETDTHLTRNMIVIGCGEGGCNIASEISKLVPNETYTIIYNTSDRNMLGLTANARLTPRGTDGSGKVRSYSKEIFKNGVHKSLISKINAGIEALNKKVDYILVCSTADGGTGSGVSPMICKLLMDNTDIPVILMGIYPSMSEDATAQYNALEWQKEVCKINVPYFILDNNDPGVSKPITHAAVNSCAARIAGLLVGKYFGNTSLSIIDDRNMFMLTHHLGQRMVAYVDQTRPTTDQTLDDYVLAMIQKSRQPEPTHMRGMGIFVKGPAEYLAKIDTSLPKVQAKYGNLVLHFQHLEESQSGITVAFLITGCAECSERINAIKDHYDDIMQTQVNQLSILDDVMTARHNPLGEIRVSKISDQVDSGKYDASALDL